MTVLIHQHNNAKSIKIGNKGAKIIEFADDTAILLEGFRSFPQEVLSILEVYGSYSGLKIITEKSELVCIGKAKRSKDK